MEKFGPSKPIRETNDLLIYCSTVKGEKIFIKQAKTENGVIANTREFYNQSFFRTVSKGQDVGFEFIQPTFDGASISYPDVNEIADWIALDSTPGIQMASLSEYSKEMVRFFKFCLQIPFDRIPKEIKEDAEKRMANVWVNFEKDSQALRESEIVTEADVQKMKNCIENGIDHRAFQHHDVVPWHMARKRADEKLILIDSGWSGWSLKYYDIAYYILQMIGYAERPDDALNFLDIAKNEFKDDSKFKKTLSTPFSYRATRLAAELQKQGKTKNAKDVLSFVLSEI